MQTYGLNHQQMNLDDLRKELEAESQEQTPSSLSKKITFQLIEEKGVTYGSFVCELKPNKEEKHCTQPMAGEDRINYPEDMGTPTADATLVKILLNSVISTKDA